jgi:hypothetical protein
MAVSGYPAAAVLVGSIDERTGEHSKAFHICEIADISIFAAWCHNGDDEHRSAKYFRETFEALNIPVIQFFRPQDEDHNDVLDRTRWSNFIVNYVAGILDQNDNALMITAHAKYLNDIRDINHLVIEAAANISGADTSFYRDITNQAWNILQSESELRLKLEAIGIHRLVDLFYGDSVGVWFRYANFFERIAPEDRPKLSVYLVCHGADFPFSPVAHLGSGSIICGDYTADLALIFKRLLATEERDKRTTQESTTGGDSLRFYFKTLGQAGFSYNFSLSPAFRELNHVCGPGGTTATITGVSDTFLDPRPGKTIIQALAGISNVGDPVWDGYEAFPGDGSRYPTKISTTVQCSGVCTNATLEFAKLTGVGATYRNNTLVTDPDRVYQKFNGNLFPEAYLGRDGVLQNFDDSGNDDPRLYTFSCSAKRGGRSRTTGSGTGGNPPSPGQITPPIVQRCDVSKGDECAVDADCGVPYCPGKLKCDIATCKCVPDLCRTDPPPPQKP